MPTAAPRKDISKPAELPTAWVQCLSLSFHCLSLPLAAFHDLTAHLQKPRNHRKPSTCPRPATYNVLRASISQLEAFIPRSTVLTRDTDFVPDPLLLARLDLPSFDIENPPFLIR